MESYAETQPCLGQPPAVLNCLHTSAAWAPDIVVSPHSALAFWSLELCRGTPLFLMDVLTLLWSFLKIISLVISVLPAIIQFGVHVPSASLLSVSPTIWRQASRPGLASRVGSWEFQQESFLWIGPLVRRPAAPCMCGIFLGYSLYVSLDYQKGKRANNPCLIFCNYKKWHFSNYCWEAEIRRPVWAKSETLSQQIRQTW
jgi:hypothetical protein